MSHPANSTAPNLRRAVVLAAVSLAALTCSATAARASSRDLGSPWSSDALQPSVAPATPAFIERITIYGNHTVRDKVIRRALRMSEGDPVDSRRLAASMRRLTRTGFFTHVTFTITRGTSRSQKVIQLQVTERPAGHFFIYVGRAQTRSYRGFRPLGSRHP